MAKASSGTASRRGLADLEAMWRSLIGCHWTSLAVIPTDDGVSVHEVVESLRIASEGASPAVRIVDARGADVATGKGRVKELEEASRTGARAVVVVDSLIRSLSGVHLVREVDAILLVVQVGGIEVDSLTSTVSLVGPGRILGSVTAPLRDDR